MTINKKSCDNEAMVKILAMSWRNQINALNSHERTKSYPSRYPVNNDSIGIEIVGDHLKDETYEDITPLQSAAFQWLLSELYKHFDLGARDVYRHPEISYKNPGAAKSVKWK